MKPTQFELDPLILNILNIPQNPKIMIMPVRYHRFCPHMYTNTREKNR